MEVYIKMSDDTTYPVDLTFAGTQINERTTELPGWNTPWGRLVHPLFVLDGRGCLVPLGTAFRFSHLGHVLTALHNVEDGLMRHHPNSAEFIRRGIGVAQGRGDLKHTHLVALTQGPNPKLGDVSLEIRAFSTMHAAPPTDLLIGSIEQNESTSSIPFISPSITFAPPRIGEIVRCVGFDEMHVPEEGLSIDDLRFGRVNPYEAYRHRLLCVTGRVTQILIQRFSRGFVNGPCFLIDAEVPHGLSGGPIFRQDGVVCGVVSAGASLFLEKPATIGSLLFPIYVTKVTFGLSMAQGRFRMQATERPICELVMTQAIQTDGAEEEQVHITPEGRSIRVGAAYHKDDAPFVFEDLDGLKQGIPAMPLASMAGVKILKPNLDHPLVRRRRGLA